ncbi:MAG TPA: helix-turn-helix transcriptional regulator [Ktedonobacteraceae bacterium]|nr:helix-turn-helix transcriptional regulator [Ktedonobacteraceae bacterium]
MMRAAKSPNVVLQHERLSRHWTQQYVADAVGTTKINVSRWERGFTRPGPYFRLKLCALFSKSEQALGMVPGVQYPPLSELDAAVEHIAASVQESCKMMVIQGSPPEKLLFALSHCFSERETSLAKKSEVPPLRVYIIFDDNGK